jgi:hypothetical protein
MKTQISRPVREKASCTKEYKQDKQSTVVAVLDGSGTVSDYWGNVRSVGNGRPVSWCGNRFMFTGRECIAGRVHPEEAVERGMVETAE